MSLTLNARVVDLYRRTLRELPRILTVFDLDMTEKELRGHVKKLFVKNAQLTDPRAIDHLLLKGEMDLQETVEVWKQKTHVFRLLELDESQKPVLKSYQGESEFLKKFYAGQN